MIDRDRRLWSAKLAAWSHDPPEKALVLMRDPAGHEGGTVAALCQACFGTRKIPDDLAGIVKRADHWAAAADRPQFPREGGDRFARWAQVRFDKEPVLIHPLTGQEFRLGSLDEVSVEAIKNVSFDHLKTLVHYDADGAVDPRRTALALWRFAPETPAPDLGAVWGLLPADTRVPDHSIFAHLDLVSALAGAMAADAQGVPALLTISLGPVQDFIAQARSTSDLWAGSHFLSRLAWEGLEVICETVGPDAVIFPQLRGTALVDRWLRDEVGLDRSLFKDERWATLKSDANPLFAAALPNRFVAVVPAAAAADLAKVIVERVRAWARNQAYRALDKLIEAAGGGDAVPAREQIVAQFDGFPEVHWAVAPWSLAARGDEIAVGTLRDALAVFHAHDEAPGFLGKRVWRSILSHPIDIAGARFYEPNPGVLYPGLYDASDRALAATKALRPFSALRQEGYRCSLCGEREWLTDDRALLKAPPGQRKDTGTLWARVAKAKPAWGRKDEHLCALCATKRLWPTLFVEDCGDAVGAGLDRYVVSTHTMALANVLGTIIGEGAVRPALKTLADRVREAGTRTALPTRLDRLLRGKPDDLAAFVRGLPGYLDGLDDRTSEGDERAERDYGDSLAALKEFGGGRASEAYYAVLLMDGDEMGAWLAGDEDKSIAFSQAFHPTIRNGMLERFGRDKRIMDYLAEKRPSSPGRHMTISSALNAFATEIAPRVVEGHFAGKLLYAGGDDLMALLPVGEALDAALMLRRAYAGTTGSDAIDARMKELIARDPGGIRKLDNGFVMGPGKHLHRLMGAKATASAGLVIAHHKTPLGVVLRAVREAERRAKGLEGKNALAIALLKRAGGETRLTLPWDNADGDPPVTCLTELAEAFAGRLSRRAAYHTLAWIDGMPIDWHASADGRAMVARLLAHQFKRQADDKTTTREKTDLAALAERVVAVATDLAEGDTMGERRPQTLVDFLTVAEFLSRGGRTGVANEGEDER